nr:hypothetical protein [Tanacetum cinerariifolium]
MIKKEKSEKLGRVPTEMELILEHTQQGISHEVLFSLSIGEIATHWFTLIMLSALRCSGNENMLGLVIMILRLTSTSLEELQWSNFFLDVGLTDILATLKGRIAWNGDDDVLDILGLDSRLLMCMQMGQIRVFGKPRKYRVLEVMFRVKKGFYADVSVGSGSGGSIRRS